MAATKTKEEAPLKDKSPEKITEDEDTEQPYFVKPEELPRSYTLYYRYPTTKPLSKSFYLDDNLSMAIKRGRAHCEEMGCLFICVRPLIVNLDLQEEYKRKDPSWNGDRNY